MKELFKSWTKKTPEEIASIWDHALISFDTNVLLDLYRISPELSKKFIELAQKLNSRIFLTKHAALEFHRNRYNSIIDNKKSLKSFSKELDDFSETINEAKFKKYLSDKSQKMLDKEVEENHKKIEQRQKYFEKLERNDTIYNVLSDLFDEKIETGYTTEQIKVIEKEGKSRYKDMIPPGYKDNNKSNGNEYGDFIIWKELIKKAKEAKKPIIFVTNDAKEDWYWILNDGKKIGPRPELLEEMQKEAGSDFILSSMENFILSASTALGKPENQEKIRQQFRFEHIFTESVVERQQKSTNRKLEKKISNLQEEKEKLIARIEKIAVKPTINSVDETKLQDLRKRVGMIDDHIGDIRKSMNAK